MMASSGVGTQIRALGTRFVANKRLPFLGVSLSKTKNGHEAGLQGTE